LQAGMIGSGLPASIISVFEISSSRFIQPGGIFKGGGHSVVRGGLT